MTLSMLPGTVFGADNSFTLAGTGGGRFEPVETTTATGAYNVVLAYNVSENWRNTATEMGIRISVTDNIKLVSAAGAYGATATGSGIINVNTATTGLANDDYVDVLLSGASASVGSVTLYFNTKKDAEGDIVATLAWRGGESSSTFTAMTRTIGWYQSKKDLSGSLGDVADFSASQEAKVNDITIKGANTDSFLLSPMATYKVTLEIATNGYEWLEKGNIDVNRMLVKETGTTGFTWKGTGTSAEDPRILEATFAVTKSQFANIAVGEVYLKGLELIATRSAVPGNVLVTLKVKGSGEDEKTLFTRQAVAKYNALGVTYTAPAKPTEVVSGKRGQVSAVLTFTEDAAKSFSGKGGRLDARFYAPAGVKFTDAQYSFDKTSEKKKITDGAEISLSSARNNDYQLTYDELIISDVAKNDPSELLVRFTMSVEPGYAAAYGDEIEIKFGGATLTGVANSEVVATVTDAIELDVDTTDLVVDRTGTFAAKQEIGALVINESKYGVIEENKDILVYVTGRGAREQLTLVADYEASVDAASGLTVGRIREDRNTGGLRFTVTKPSSKTAAEITLPGLSLFGFILPGVTYEIVVAGESIAESYYDNASNANTANSTAKKLDDGYFDTAFSAPVLKAVPVSAEPTAPGYVPGTGVGEQDNRQTSQPLLNGTVFQSSDGPITTPFRISTTQANSGLIAPRAFAESVGLKIDWLGGGNVMISDPYNGTQLRYTVGSETGYVNGAPYTFLNNDGAPVKVEATDNGGRTWLPARALGNIFGFQVVYIDEKNGGPGIQYVLLP